ncbi:hypothetical protein [Arcanobacterium canis]
MTPPQHNDQNKRSTTSIHFNPKHWTTRTKIIASIAALALILTGVGVTFAYRTYTVERDCVAQAKVFTDQKTDLNKALQEAHDALSSVDASVKIGEGKRLAHTDGFPLSPEGQKAITELDKAMSTAAGHKSATVPQCVSSDDLAALNTLIENRAIDLDALNTQISTLTTERDKYRLTKAADEAQSSMDKAKTDLATAQKNATDQLKAVEADSALQGDATVKSRYDALKKIEKDSHSVSTTVTVSTYDEAVASIEKTKTVVSKTGEVNTATQALKDAIKAYNDAKAAQAAQAQSQAASGSGGTSEYSGGGGSNWSNNSGSNDWSDTGGNSHDWDSGDTYTPPAPAPAPAPPSNNGGGSGGQILLPPPNIDWDNTHGCVHTEGIEVCH